MATTNGTTTEEYQAKLAEDAEKLIDLDPVPDPAPVDPLTYPPPKVPMPPCTDLLLAQATADPEIEEFYKQYFARSPHKIFTDDEEAGFTCLQPGDSSTIFDGARACLPPGCTTLSGIRGSAIWIKPPPVRKISRLFTADVVWLYWMERMGLFAMQTKLVNDYAIEGRYPIYNNDMTAVTLEVMARQFQTGSTSLTRDRVSTYRRCLGWTTPTGRKMDLRTEVNTAFNSQFHLFIKTALLYYKDRRLAEAIQQSAFNSGSSASTRVAVVEALQLLEESMAVFAYGRNNYNTLNGVVNAVATLRLIRKVRHDLGVPTSLTKPSQYVSAAYSMLIEGKSATAYKPNRYLLHKDCAENGRDILLDIIALDTQDVEKTGLWLENTITERRIETYRKAYRDITKIDVAEDIQNIEQQA